MSVEVVIAGKDLLPPKKLLVCERCEAVLSFLPEDVVPIAEHRAVVCPACKTINTLRQPAPLPSPTSPAK